MLHKETIAFAWETQEFDFKEKRKDWYWIVSIVAVILIVIAIILSNYLFAFVVGISAFLMISLASKKPLTLPVEISEQGIKIYTDMYPYDALYGFWISTNKREEPILLVLSNRKISPILSINIHPDIDPMAVRQYLSEFLDETEMKESLTDRIIDKIGF